MKSFYLEHVACDLCESDSYTVLYRAPDAWLWLTLFEFPVVRCESCGLVYVNPRPTAEALADYYPTQFYSDRDNAESRVRYQHELKRLPSLASGRVLDIGCARGDFPAFLKAAFPQLEVYGCDAYSDRVNSADIKFYSAHIYDCGFPDSYFDLITSWAVFEHLLTPSRYFAEVARTLKPGGAFIMLVPNADSLSSAVARAEDIPRHTYHYSKETLQQYAKKYDMRIKRIEYCDDIYDGRGFGALIAAAARLLRITPLDAHKKNIGFVPRGLLRIVKIFDKLLFATHWEAKLKRGGIIVATFEKVCTPSPSQIVSNEPIKA